MRKKTNTAISRNTQGSSKKVKLRKKNHTRDRLES